MIHEITRAFDFTNVPVLQICTLYCIFSVVNALTNAAINLAKTLASKK